MKKSPSETFNRVYELLKSMNLVNKEIVVELSGHSYKARCDETSFMVFRVHNNLGPRSHVPGWPVCLITRDTIFEECCASEDPSVDSFHCQTGLDSWIEIIASTCDRTESTSDPNVFSDNSHV